MIQFVKSFQHFGDVIWSKVLEVPNKDGHFCVDDGRFHGEILRAALGQNDTYKLLYFFFFREVENDWS